MDDDADYVNVDDDGTNVSSSTHSLLRQGRE